MSDKCLSIITNFGCHFTCPYCVTKNNGINVPATTIESLDLLKPAVGLTGANIISVSGGGDPLYLFHKHIDYYTKLFELCYEMNIPLELHTSYTNAMFPYEWCHRVVYHCRGMASLLCVRRRGTEKVRVVFVVTEDFTKEKIDKIANYVERTTQIDELSFRQMIDKDYKVTDYCQEYLRAGHKKRWWYIEQNDYNTYFVNGKLYYKYSDIGLV